MDLDGIGPELGAQNIGKAGEAAGRAGQSSAPCRWRALLAGQRKGDVGAAHGEAAGHFANGLALAAIALEEFEPGGRGVKQVAHFDAGPLAESSRSELGFAAALYRDGPGVRLAGVARSDAQPRDCADGRQRLSAKTEGADIEEVVLRKLRCGVAIDG